MATAKEKITFYDTLCNVPEKSLSPWTPVTHLCLVYKGLPFDHRLVEFAHVQTVSAKVGFAKPLSPSGQETRHTFPAIEDPNTGAKIVDSFDIAEYLDKTYADQGRPLLIPPGTRALQKAFVTALTTTQNILAPIALPLDILLSTEYSREYFVATIETLIGKKIEEFRVEGDEAIKTWAQFKEVVVDYNSWFEKGKEYIGGDAPILADFYLAARLYFLRSVFGRESREWKDISTWNGGRWSSYLDKILKQYPLQ